MHYRWAAILTGMLLAMSVPSSTAALQRQQPLRVWGMVGAGAGGSTQGDGFVATVQVTAQRAPHQVTTRIVLVTTAYNVSTTGEVGALYGRTLVGDRGHVAASVGLGIAVGDPPCSDGSTACSTQRRIALPVAAEASLRLFSIAGIGAQVLGNVSGLGFTAGAVVFVQVGWLPRR